MKYLATYHNFEKAPKRFNYKSGNPTHFRKNNWRKILSNHTTMCYNSYDNRIDINEIKHVFKDLNEISKSDDWFPYEYIDAEFNKKVNRTKGQLTGDEI